MELTLKESLVKGRPAKIKCVEISGQTYSINKGLVRVLGLEDEWYEDIRDPNSVIQALVETPRIKPDLFTFWQRLPEVEPKYPYYREWQDIAVLSVKSYEHWW